MIIIDDMEQCAQEWFQARAGTPTASNFDKIITSQGKRSTQRTKYMYQLVGERLLGDKPEGYSNAAMERGMELEAEARSVYAMSAGVEVKEVSLCYADEKKMYACSPDGLVFGDSNGGVEIKCPSLPVHVEYMFKRKLPTTYFCQVQGCLFVTGHDWWDFVSYYPGMPLFTVRVYPDLDFHAKLEKELGLFCGDLDFTYNELNNF